MRLGFKHFNIGKREFCITAWRWLDFGTAYKMHKDGTQEEFRVLESFDLNILPVIKYSHSWSTKTIYLAWLFWMVEIEDETYQNTGCYEPELEEV
jgi:hypothetical protein